MENSQEKSDELHLIINMRLSSCCMFRYVHQLVTNFVCLLWARFQKTAAWSDAKERAVRVDQNSELKGAKTVNWDITGTTHRWSFNLERGMEPG